MFNVKFCIVGILSLTLFMHASVALAWTCVSNTNNPCDCETAYPGYACLKFSADTKQTYDIKDHHCGQEESVKCAKMISTVSGSGILPTPGDKAHSNPPSNLSSDANLGNYEIDDLLRLGVNITNWILGMVGSASLLMFIWGGFQWLISQGEPSKIATGKKIMSSAVIGIVITFSSYIIIKFVIENVLGMSWSGGLVNF